MILYLLIGGVVGFVVGALVFRNNQKKFDELIAKVQDTLDKLEDQI